MNCPETRRAQTTKTKRYKILKYEYETDYDRRSCRCIGCRRWMVCTTFIGLTASDGLCNNEQHSIRAGKRICYDRF